MRLWGKVVVVTGGAGLLGQSFCRGVAAEGATVVVADRDSSASESVAKQIVDAGGAAWAFALDITDPSSVARLIEAAAARSDVIDAVVNNAYPRNKQYGRRLEDVEFTDFCENLNSHLGGYFLVSQKFAAVFKAQGHGNIINMTSVYATMPPRLELYDGTTLTMPVEYAAIKAGILHLTRYLAQYYKADGIRCNCVSPGGVRDAQPESFQQRYDAHCGRRGMLEPDDLVGALTFLLSDESRYMTGQNLIVDDGFSL